ncbi:hypothetical protein [Clostridium sp. OS1-26]|uniref:hypothetical protein n=1 Tax=Clostridium sp. OS1-26 TaxID=3070681 RepID=UPI0027DEF353|nr:hypothetical protein [Clostridium sp. OS1-26]WML32766.1 hypothetical protein RCG18_15475 [Clostridium sp. OS1-26]
MKRIVNLKIELALFALISLIVSVWVFLYLGNNAPFISNKSDEERIEEVTSLYLHYFKKDLEKIDLKDKNIYEKLANMLNAHGFEFYIVNKNGDVIAAPNKDVTKIDADKIIDGKREISNLKFKKTCHK